MANSNIEIKALGEANFADNNNGDITPLKMREVFNAMLNHLGGNVYLVNSSTTPQTADANTPIILENDGAGALSVTKYRPHYLDASVFLAGNKIHTDDLINSTIVSMRLECEFVTSANTNAKLTAVFRDSLGAEAFRLQFSELYYKNAATHKLTTNFQFFMDSNIENGTMEIVYESDTNSTAILKSIMADIR